MIQPSYFAETRENASRRWAQLEADPELAGPWRQLFRQVQSPRHVLSELLQNADDAGATEAAAEIVDGEFIFAHDGEDFTAEQFASLCRFGFSNKRNLHTIGFRGVGFKSTFSLGDDVHLVTPTLSVTFHEQRFTQPEWAHHSPAEEGRTEVRVSIKNQAIEEELRRNLEEWRNSPTSLLFFNSIRRLRIGGQEIRWESLGRGPVEDSEWMAVSSSPGSTFLLVRSQEEEFPVAALNEIRDERMADDEETAFPPCRVEIVLGMKGRLFVVLGTGVTTLLPFACNAPFIQDPARVEIKDPATSPTNRWLLKRCGELAAGAMLGWVNNSSLALEERSQAYNLFPGIQAEDASLQGSCGAIVKKAFNEEIEGESFLLSEDGELQPTKSCLSVPPELLDVWPASLISEKFGQGRLTVLSRFIEQQDIDRLTWDEHIETLTYSKVWSTLRHSRLPRPESWRGLLSLWTYLADTGKWFLYNNTISSLRIVPVQGRDELFAAEDVVRVDRARTLKASDLEFLSRFLLILDSDWPEFLARQLESAEVTDDSELESRARLADRVMGELGLARPTTVDRILQSFTDSFFHAKDEDEYETEDCVRIAHIAARLRASAPLGFQYAAQDGMLLDVNDDLVLADIDGKLDMFVDPAWYECNVLRDEYSNLTDTCSAEEWRDWVLGPESRLHTFVPLTRKYEWVRGRDKLESLLRQRGYRGELSYHYKSSDFRITDWDFPEEHWQYWSELAQEDEFLWSALLTHILQQPVSFWSRGTSATVYHFATNGHSRLISQGNVCPRWLIRLRDLACLPDTYGYPRQPAELLRRTRETEGLLGVEPFVDAELDNETTRPLLRLLGVGDRPTGPERLLERLQALATGSEPLVSEIHKWCYSLDQIFDRCSTDDVKVIRATFAANKLILNEEGKWSRTDEVFLSSNDYEIPGAILVHPSLHGMALWRKIGVADRPTVEMEMNWLGGLETGQKLETSQSDRVASLLSSYPKRVWDECGHWLSLERTWVKVESLEYSLTMQSLTAWTHLFPNVKSKTADFRMLSLDTWQSKPFSDLRTLGEVIEEIPDQQLFDLPESKVKEWISALGEGLRRVVVDDPVRGERLQALALRLSQTEWQLVEGLRATPYVNSSVAGTSRSIDVLWRNNILYVKDGNLARLASKVPQEIAKAFATDRVTDAIKMCYERDPAFIEAYLEDNFDLTLQEEANIPEEVPPIETGSVFDVGNQDDIGAQDAEGELSAEEEAEGELIKTGGNSNGSSQVVKRHKQSPGIIEKYMRSAGFTEERNGGFHHSDGRWMGRTGRVDFRWACYSPEGVVHQFFWSRDHCLQREPLQIDAEIWSLCEQEPHKYSLILANLNGTPVVVSGSELLRMRNKELVTVYPATYRLVYEVSDD